MYIPSNLSRCLRRAYLEWRIKNRIIRFSSCYSMLYSQWVVLVVRDSCRKWLSIQYGCMRYMNMYVKLKLVATQFVDRLLSLTQYVFLFRLSLLPTRGFIRSQRLLPPFLAEPLLSPMGAPVRGITSSNVTNSTT